jgi:T-complex protein 1 subunit theta
MYAKATESSHFGIDVRDGKVKDVVKVASPVLDSMETKSWALKLAFDVVLTILKVDQIIMSKPSGGPKMDQAARRPDGYDE